MTDLYTDQLKGWILKVGLIFEERMKQKVTA